MRIGFLPEESYLYRYLSARETLDFYGRLFGLGRQVRRMRTEALLEMVGLNAVGSRPVGMFSKGMARRIGLAQSLINDPDLLILDEPTTGLDPIGTRQIKDLIIELAKRGKTILLSSHLLADVEDVCDRIAILYGGRVQAQGRVKDLLAQTGKKQITTGNLNEAALEKIRRIVEQEQLECVVTSPMDRLETFFIRTVTEAQKQAQPTSGAVSTTQISGFLTEKGAVKSILDELVSTPESIAAVTSATAGIVGKARKAADAGAKSHVSETRPDHDMLAELTKPAEVVQPKPIGTSQEVDSSGTKEEQFRKSLLDELAGRIKSDEKKGGQSLDGAGDA
jgi:ABC-2 type transport system ATP-binding protein